MLIKIYNPIMQGTIFFINIYIAMSGRISVFQVVAAAAVFTTMERMEKAQKEVRVFFTEEEVAQ